MPFGHPAQTRSSADVVALPGLPARRKTAGCCGPPDRNLPSHEVKDLWIVHANDPARDRMVDIIEITNCHVAPTQRGTNLLGHASSTERQATGKFDNIGVPETGFSSRVLTLPSADRL